jgi:hypothetical protein
MMHPSLRSLRDWLLNPGLALMLICSRIPRIDYMFGKFFDTAEVNKYADLVVAEVKRALPAGYDHNIKNVSDRTNTLDQRIARQVETFTQSTKLNIYKKARLAARVREALTAQGYPAKFVEAFSLDLLNRIQKASKLPRV